MTFSRRHFRRTILSASSPTTWGPLQTPRRPAPEEESPLRAESALVLHAREAIRAGDCDGALQRLNAAVARFPAGMLAQEREALSIEALGCAGDEAEAATRAAAFLRDYPASPHASVIRRFVR